MKSVAIFCGAVSGSDPLIKLGLTAKELFNKLIVSEAYKIDRWENSRS